MQVMDEKKRENILSAAAELFATRPFHKVVLSDVAERAGVGKGTVYIYFKNKDDLYHSVLLKGFSGLVTRLETMVMDKNHDPVDDLRRVIKEIVSFSFKERHIYDMMRSTSINNTQTRALWLEKVMELKTLILSIIERGISAGVFDDPDPELTARFIPGFVRSVFIYGSDGLSVEHLSRHIFGFILKALTHTDSRKG